MCVARLSGISQTDFIPLCRPFKIFRPKNLRSTALLPFTTGFLEWTVTVRFITDGLEPPATEG
jgi:hypothetical protein